MQQTTNLELNKFDLSDNMKTTTRQGLNENADILDGAFVALESSIGDLDDLTTTHKDNLVNAINDAAENGGIAVQDTAPTNDVLAWVDSDALGADFCFVGDTAPATDGTVAIWVDTSQDEIPIQSGAGGVSYDNTESGLTADNVQGAIDEELDKIDILSNTIDTERLRYPDLTKSLHSITTIGASYTATKYCWAIGYTRGQGGSSSIVYVNGVQIAVGASDGYGVSTVMYPLRPNDVIATRNNLQGEYYIIIYDTIE